MRSVTTTPHISPLLTVGSLVVLFTRIGPLGGLVGRLVGLVFALGLGQKENLHNKNI